MTDLTEFEEIGRKRQRHHDRVPCKLADALARLTGEELEKVTAALEREHATENAPAIRPSWIAQWLREKGHHVTETSIANHRAERCRCYA